jgi:Putative mono-oxygenase ydhR
MKALLLKWELKELPKEIFARLRIYVAQESWPRYAKKKGLVQKVWFSNPETGDFGGFYLWETEEDMEEEIRTMYRVKAMTGMDPIVQRWDVEAIQQGLHSVTDLKSTGLAWDAA